MCTLTFCKYFNNDNNTNINKWVSLYLIVTKEYCSKGFPVKFDLFEKHTSKTVSLKLSRTKTVGHDGPLGHCGGMLYEEDDIVFRRVREAIG